MADMTEAEIQGFILLGQGVAEALGPEWTATYLNQYGWRHDVNISRPDGATIRLTAYGLRVEICGLNPGGSESGVKGISVACDRGPVVIAREITRRFLSTYLYRYKEACEEAERKRVYEDGRRKALETLASIIGLKITADEKISLTRYKNLYGTMTMSTPDIGDIHVRHAPLGLLMMLAKEIKLWNDVQEVKGGHQNTSERA